MCRTVASVVGARWPDNGVHLSHTGYALPAAAKKRAGSGFKVGLDVGGFGLPHKVAGVVRA